MMRKTPYLSVIATFLSAMEAYSAYLPVVPTFNDSYVEPVLSPDGTVTVSGKITVDTWEQFVAENGSAIKAIDLSSIDPQSDLASFNNERTLIIAIVRNIYDRAYNNGNGVSKILLRDNTPVEWRTMLANAFVKVNALSSTTKDSHESSCSDYDDVPLHQPAPVHESTATEFYQSSMCQIDEATSASKLPRSPSLRGFSPIKVASKSPIELGDSPTLPEEK